MIHLGFFCGEACNFVPRRGYLFFLLQKQMNIFHLGAIIFWGDGGIKRQ